MEKVVRSALLVLMVLAVAGVANAGWTTTVYNTAVSSEVTLNKSYQWGTGGVGYDYNVDWTHAWTVPSDPDFTSVDLVSANLSIDSQYTSSKTESVRADSLANPSLGDLQDGVTSFDVASYVPAPDSDLKVLVTLFEEREDFGTVKLNKSTLDLTYQITKRVWVDDPIPVVPAPAAILLSSFGAGLAGWIRRRGLV